MRFTLHRDKMVTGIGGIKNTFLEAGTYDVVRLFDGRRIMVATNNARPRQVTILGLKDGKLLP